MIKVVTRVRILSLQQAAIFRIRSNSIAKTGHAGCDPAGRVESLAAVFVVVSSVGLSIGLSRLAVGEMFRFVRSDARKRNAQPPAA